MNEKTDKAHLKEMVWVIRFYALVIIATIIISDATSWLPEGTDKFIIMLMALLAIAQSFRPYLLKHPKVRNVVIWIIAGLLILGIVVFLLVR